MDSCTSSTSISSEISSGACHLCSKTFKNVKLRNRHIKRMHKIDVCKKKINHIVCPLCEQETNCESHEKLRKHLKDHHKVSIELITFEFSSKQEYETWKDMQKIETRYTKSRVTKGNDYKILYYECNRSNINGYKPNYKIKTEKSGGSIKIKGVCPSRLVCRLRDQGQVSVSCCRTHAGHKEELRTMRLSKEQEKWIVEKLMSGVSPSRILDDSRKLETPKLGRLALLTSQDITNLCRKYNIHKKQDQNDQVATALKECNANNKNYAFLLKKEDDDARCLGENSIIKSSHEEEIIEFIGNKLEHRNVIQENTIQQRLQDLQHLKNVMDSLVDLDDESYTQAQDKVIRVVEEALRKSKEKFQEATKDITKKRKMEKQPYFPSNKKRS
ncbi:unnamed protein product [Diabrotica balteata]|uniref:C2H2-type domain-containing protein n=1 Tax=Diabrotica balteata TaxID=107213 RepID=A0A9N9T4A7_DIABA|nr:unnamed protein product [Diabrotica balteata]